MWAETSGDASDLSLWETTLDALGDFGIRLIKVAVVIIVCVLVALLLRRIIRRVVKRIVDGRKSKAGVVDTRALERSPLASVRVVQRTRTLGAILSNIVNVTMFIVALVLTVYILAPGVLGSLSLLTAAVGAGLGFGAQNIVKDVLNGIFIVAEDQIGIGDVVDLGDATGVVEAVHIRTSQVRDVNGTLWHVRNGEITRIGNMSQGWSRVVIDLAAPRDTDLNMLEQLSEQTAASLAHDPLWRARVIDQPEVWGLELVDADSMVVRVVIKAIPAVRDDVAQELRRRLRDAFSEHSVAITGITETALVGADGAMRVHGANPPTTAVQLPSEDDE
ncbi:MAG: mechanosensitive ion channel [Microbacterium sp.]